MIPAPFTYRRAWPVDEALELAGQSGDDAKFLAGGHSLLPLMSCGSPCPKSSSTSRVLVARALAESHSRT